MAVQIIRDAETLTREIDALKADGGTIAFVPTMGALHEGHMALVAEGKLRGSHVVASIFVNPTQFGEGEDLAVYPRREATDAALLDAAGVAILWAPEVETMYPDGPEAALKAGPAAAGLDGASRPGHFDGVVTVVARLFEQVRPDVAVFGEKDYQQLAVIRQMVESEALPVEIVGIPTQRDADGLALSSRNAISRRRSAPPPAPCRARSVKPPPRSRLAATSPRRWRRRGPGSKAPASRRSIMSPCTMPRRLRR